MKYGFIKTAASTPKIRVADPTYNAEAILKIVREAAEAGVKLLVLPELSLSGYTCADLFASKKLIDSVETSLLSLAEQTCRTDLLFMVGAPLKNRGKLFNCAVILSHGRILGVVPKSNIPNYSEFYEYRHFTPAPPENGEINIGGVQYPFGPKLLFRCRQMPTFCAAVEICEDVWVPQHPSIAHAVAGATVIANLSASNEVIGKDGYRRLLVQSKSAQLICGYIYADAGEGESSTDLVFSGHNLIGENGVVLAESLPFSGSGHILTTEIDVERLTAERAKMNTYPLEAAEGYQIIPFDTAVVETPLTRHIDPHPFVPADQGDRAARCLRILDIQSRGLMQRIERSYADGAILAISGGLDSCLALLVTVRAMDALSRDRKKITAISMPCFGTTSRTRTNAEILCGELGVDFRTIDIAEAVTLHFRDIGHDAANLNVVFENAQARERTQIVMDTANAQNSLAIGTGDLSELALGWATYNGDQMSMYGVNASVPKTLVRHIVSYCADDAERKGEQKLAAVLRDIVATPVSPELLPPRDGEISQKTEDIVGPYDLHDFFLYHFLRFGYTPSKIYALARIAFHDEYSSAIILKWLKTFTKRFFSQQYKRSCMPDGPKVGSVALSPRGDWRMPSDASSDIWTGEMDLFQ